MSVITYGLLIINNSLLMKINGALFCIIIFNRDRVFLIASSLKERELDNYISIEKLNHDNRRIPNERSHNFYKH